MGPIGGHPALVLARIHRSAWNRYSRKLNFAFHDFYEVRIERILGSSLAGSCINPPLIAARMASKPLRGA
jgi:hypothetical protein